MNRLISVIGGLFIVFGTVLPLPAKESSEFWKRLYARSNSLQQKYAVMQNLIEQDDANLAPTLQSALEELVRMSSALKSPTDKDSWTQLCRLIVGGLGKSKATEASAVIYACYQSAENPILKSEALTAIGKVKGIDYNESITLILKDLNLSKGSDSQASEIIAYGCINALEKLRGGPAYKQVFLASTGWYSSRIKDRAKAALANIVEDPTDILGEIIKESGPEVKIAALQTSEASQAPEAKKIGLAVQALQTGHFEQTQDSRKTAVYGELRKQAIDMLVKYKAKNEASVEPLKQSIDNAYDINEKLASVTALGINGGDAATKVLAGFLEKQNERQAAGITEHDNRFNTALMRALGAARNPLARPALLAVEFSNYTPAMVRVSKEALKEIEKK